MDAVDTVINDSINDITEFVADIDAEYDDVDFEHCLSEKICNTILRKYKADETVNINISIEELLFIVNAIYDSYPTVAECFKSSIRLAINTLVDKVLQK